MAGETEDTVSESRSTEDLLSETDRIFSETESLTGTADDADSGNASETRTDETADTETSWRSRLSPSIGPSTFFSVRAYAGLLGALALGYVAGWFAIPDAGSIIGLFATAFVVGAVTSKRRYTEVAAAGGSVGAVAALFNYFVVVAGGLGEGLVLVGMTAGLLACLLGYYFGRDLRDGLTSEL